MKFSPKLKSVLLPAVLATGVTMFVAAAAQQNYRFSADDPQIQLAEDAAAALAAGTAPAEIVGEGHVNAATSLAPFVTVYDAHHQVLATSGTFDGQTLSPPPGVFDNVKSRGYERFTWATATGVREAAVLVYKSGSHPGYVLAARNLREVEAREQNIRLMTLVTLVAIALVATGFAFLL